MRSAKTIRLNSLGLKVLLTYVAGVLLSIALAVTAAVVILPDGVVGMELADRATSLAKGLEFDANGKPVGLRAGQSERDWLYDTLPNEAAYRVLDEAGNVALLSAAGQSFWPPEGSGPGLARGDFVFERDGVKMYGATEPMEHRGKVWHLQFAASARLTNLIHHKFALPFIAAGLGVFSVTLIIAFGLCAYVMLVYALKPLRDISDSAAAISPRSLHARLDTGSVPSEIGPLVDSFNRVLERLERGYRLQQDFLANAAHELKTPLALMRAQIELRDDGRTDRDSLLRDVDYMTRQVQQLLLLAEASEAHNYSFGSVEVQEIAHETIAFLQRMAEAAEVNLKVSHAIGGVRWQADRGALLMLLKNLLENAIQHAPRKSEVSVDILQDEITVRDRGPGVDPADLPHLFTRFWRGAHRRDRGAGLGLAICEEIALAHGWRLTAEPAEPGLRFRVTKP
jgi:signal transduction histidine kinase